jgi:diguanylate cyclase (GGDEF)-like protein
MARAAACLPAGRAGTAVATGALPLALPAPGSSAYGWLAVAVLAVVLYGVVELVIRRRPWTGPDRAAGSERNIRLLVAAVLALFLGVVIANLVLSLRNTRQTVLAEAGEDATNLALAIEHELAGTLDSVAYTMSVIARSAPAPAPAGAPHAASADALLNGAAQHLPAVSAFWIVDAQGRLAHASRDLPQHGVSLQRDYVRAHLTRSEDRLFFGHPMRRADGRLFIPVSRRITRADGGFGGVVAASLRPEYLAGHSRTIDVGRDGFVALMRTDGTIMQQADVPTTMLGRPVHPTPPFVALLERADSGVYRTAHSHDGIERVVAYRRLPGRPLVVVVAFGVDELLAPWRETAATYAAGSLLLLVLLTLVALRLARELDRRAAQQTMIERLNRTRAMQSGISSLIVRAATRSELFEGACRVAVREGGFGAAWVDVLDDSTRRLTTVASAGDDARHVLAEPIWTVDDDGAVEKEPFRRHGAVSSNDLAARADHSPRHHRAVELGYRSRITLPLFRRSEPVATLTLLARPAGFFNEEEVRLLDDVAGDLSHALEHLAALERVEYLALHDVLTGLPNHALFIDRVTQRLRQANEDGTRCALAKLDIERFRQINETVGRDAGDEVVRRIAARLRGGLDEDIVLARPERDHFVFLVDVQSDAEAASAVQKARHACCSAPMTVEGHELHISLRAGVSLYPDDGRDAETLMRNAEAALARAKHTRDPMTFYAPAMNARVAESLGMENKLRGALERGEFVLHYQPKFDVHDGSLVGLEALLRWNDPEAGLTPPARFVPVLEDTGLILPVGEWVLQEALRDYRRWRAAGLRPPRVAVNVSALQLRQDAFTQSVRSVIRGSGDGGPGLELEITESMLMTRVESNADKLDAIRGMGVSIAIDDFGTGYSSLQYIARLPLDTLKIDRSFVAGMTCNATDREIVSSVISLAHQLRLKVVAEGVESPEQARLLRDLDCDEVQGYLFSPPLPRPDIEKLMRALGRRGSATMH